MGRRGIKAVLVIAILGSIGAVAYKVSEHLWLMKAREIQKNPAKVLDYLPQAAVHVKDFRRSQIEKGRKVWEVTGEEASYVKEKGEAIIKKPRFVFYQKGGETLEATGNEARLFLTDEQREMEKLQLTGKVQVHYQGYVLYTEEIVYLKAKDHVILPGKVTVQGEGLELEGVGMEIALQDEKMRLLQKVKTKLEPELWENSRAASHGKKKVRP